VGNKTLIYKQKVLDNLNEAYKHLQRLDDAYKQLEKINLFPLDEKKFSKIIHDVEYLAYSDQIIYRFSKLQDCMGAKLFKSILLYQGENTDKPFLDILNQLEKWGIIDVDEWFEFRDIRNEIAHDYEDNSNITVDMINTLYQRKHRLKQILDTIQEMLK